MANRGIIRSIETSFRRWDTMIIYPTPISRQVRSEIARRRFLLEEGLRRVSRYDNMGIPSEANPGSFRNIEDMARGKEERMWALIATLGYLVAVVVLVQSWTLT